MLCFACKPDEVFNEFFKKSLEECIGFLTQDIDDEYINFVEMYFEKEMVKSFGDGIDAVKMIRNEIQKLLKAHSEETVYMPTDRHFKLLDRILRYHCDVYSDEINLAIEVDSKDVDSLIIKKPNGEPIQDFDFEFIFNIFFYDNDYDFNIETVKKLKRGSNLRSPDCIRSSINTLIDTSDLILTPCKDYVWDTPEEYDW